MAIKFVRAQASSSTLSFIARLCFGSIVISTAALALIAAIMQGFHDATLKTLKGMSPDLIIKSSHDYLNVDKITNIIAQEFATSITTAMPCNTYHVLLQHPKHSRDFSHVALLAAIDETKVNNIMPFTFTHACSEHNHSAHDLTEDTIIIGNILAEDLHISCGDTVLIRYPEEHHGTTEQLSFSTTKARVVGLFHSGVEEWDARGAFIALSFAHSFFNDDNLIQQLHIKLAPQADVNLVQQSLHKRLHLPVISWYDMNPALVSALTLEKCAMLSIIILIMLIAGVTTAALLCMQLTYHTRTIAVLAAYGMSYRTITTMFVMYGILITLIATLLGLSIASVVSYLIDHYQLISLPTIYYAQYVPACMSWEIWAMVLLLSLTISGIAAWYPARKIKDLPLARILADV